MMQSSRWITYTKTQPRIRLFCLPYAGGGASVYRLWGQKLPLDVEVCPIYLPGREQRLSERPYTELAPLVEALAAELRPSLDVPFACFGHSLGALLAYELARYLRAHGEPTPTHLFVSAYRAPQLPFTRSPIHHLPEKEFRAELYKLGGTPAAVLQHEELMQLLLPVIRADFTIYEKYIYQPDKPLSCPITAFGGRDDYLVSPAELATWREQTTSPFALSILPGDHFFLQSAQNILLKMIARSLNDMQA